jgi:hypothetical protein
MDHIDLLILLLLAWVIVVPSKWLVAERLAGHLERDWPLDWQQLHPPKLLEATSPVGSSGGIYQLLLSGRYRALNSSRSTLSVTYAFGALICWVHVLVSATIVAIPLWYYVLYPALADIYSRA